MAAFLSKVFLGPVLLAQAQHVRRTALRLPEAAGARQGVESVDGASGERLRVLVVGDSSAAGVGVSMQDEAFAQPMARALSRGSRRPVAWQLVAKSGVCAREAIELLRASDVGPADVLVTAVGVNDVTGQRGARGFCDDVCELWHVAVGRAGVRFGVFSGLPPMHICPAAPQPLRWYLGRYAARLDASLERWVREDPKRRFCSLQWATDPRTLAVDRFHPGPKLYRLWAGRVADQIMGLAG